MKAKSLRGMHRGRRQGLSSNHWFRLHGRTCIHSSLWRDSTLPHQWSHRNRDFQGKEHDWRGTPDSTH